MARETGLEPATSGVTGRLNLKHYGKLQKKSARKKPFEIKQADCEFLKRKPDRAAVMRDAHKRYRDGIRLGLGWSFSRCLSTAWVAERQRIIFSDQAARMAS